MDGIHHQLAIRAPRERVYQLIAEPALIGRWWGEQSVAETPEGTVLSHQAGPYGTVRLRVLEQTPGERVVWACIGDYPPDNPASAWVGTEFVFTLSDDANSGAAMVERAVSAQPIGTLTTLDFRQPGYDLNGRFAGFNNLAWALVLQALKQVCETTPPETTA